MLWINQSTNGEWKAKSKRDREISIWEDRKRRRERVRRQEEGVEGRKKRRKERRQEKRNRERKKIKKLKSQAVSYLGKHILS